MGPASLPHFNSIHSPACLPQLSSILHASRIVSLFLLGSATALFCSCVAATLHSLGRGTLPVRGATYGNIIGRVESPHGSLMRWAASGSSSPLVRALNFFWSRATILIIIRESIYREPVDGAWRSKLRFRSDRFLLY